MPGARAARGASSAWCPAGAARYLLPNLVGVENALKVIIENPLNQNRMLKGPQAFELGIADAMFEPADFLEESLRWAAAVLTGEVVVERPEVDRDERRGTAPSQRGQGLADAKTGGAAPGAVPRARPARGRAHRRPATRASPPRTRRSPT